MKNLNYFFVLLFVFPSIVCAQYLALNSAVSWGGEGSLSSRLVIEDDEGNQYGYGRYSGEVDIQPGPNEWLLSSDEEEFVNFVYKIDSEDNVLWVKNIYYNYFGIPRLAGFDTEGNIIVGGTYANTFRYDDDNEVLLESEADYNTYFLKLTTGGELIWVKSFDGGANFNNNIKVVNETSVKFAGFFEGNTDFDPSDEEVIVSSSEFGIHYVIELDTDGNLLNYNFGNGFSDFYLHENEDETLLYFGSFYDNSNTGVDIDLGDEEYILNNVGDRDAYIRKVDALENFIWAVSFGGVERDDISSIEITDTNETYALLYTEGDTTIDFDDITGETTSYELTEAENWILLKLSEAGELIWSTVVHESFDSDISSIRTDDTGIYLFGSTNGTATLTSNGERDIYISKLDFEGNVLWEHLIGAEGNEGISDVDLLEDGSFDIYGSFSATVDFAPGAALWELSAVGENDLMKINLSPCDPSFGTDQVEACESIVWIDGNTYTEDNNTAVFALSSVSGCDSIVSLELTILENSSGVDTHVRCESFEWLDGVVYTESNHTASFNLTNAAGCDSILSLDLSIFSDGMSVVKNGDILEAETGGISYQWIDCTNGNTVIEGAVNDTFEPEVDGTYAVIIESEDCTVTSSCFDVNWLNTQDLSISDVKIYPNPVQNELQLSFPKNQQSIKYTITDVLGNVLLQESETNTDHIHFAVNYPSGIYFLMIQTDTEHTAIRFIKE